MDERADDDDAAAAVGSNGTCGILGDTTGLPSLDRTVSFTTLGEGDAAAVVENSEGDEHVAVAPLSLQLTLVPAVPELEEMLS